MFHIKKHILAAIVVMITALPTFAGQALVEKDAFAEKVREALLKHPDILLEVFYKIEQMEQAEAAEKDLALVAANKDQLFGDVETGTPTLVEFIDYACSYCKRATPIVRSLKDNNPDLVVTTIQFPILGEDSVLASEIALVVEKKYPEAFSTFHEALMNLSAPLSEETIRGVLETMEVPAEVIFQAAKAPEISQALADNRALAQSLEISGTPGFVGKDGILRGLAQEDHLAKLAGATAQQPNNN